MASKKERPQDRMTIRVGSGWARFALKREGIELLGVVVQGQEIGALGKLPDGSYVQVNGDVVRTVNASRVELALRRSGFTPPESSAACITPSSIECPLPTVIVKKRRLAPSVGEATSVETSAKLPNTPRQRLTLRKAGDAPSSGPDAAEALPSPD